MNPKRRHESRPADCLAGGGAMGALMRATDWSATPLGPVERWPQSLRTAISIMLESKFAMVVAWGPEYRFFYNDRYTPVLGTKHPASLGKPGAELFPEVWDQVGPEFDRVWNGEAFAIDDWLLPLARRGYLENCWFTLSYSPIRDESGGVGGVLAVVAETTERVEGERRLAILRDLARRAADAKATDEACRAVADVFAQSAIDVPFALLHLLDDDGTIRRVAAAGLPPGHPALDGWPLAEVLESGAMRVIENLDARFGPMPGGAYPEPADTAVVYPLGRPGLERPYGVLVAGVSPRRRFDDAYRGFFDLAAEHITTAIGNAHAFEEERRRAEALAEIDRAKTTFFSNVSHEFRTPLTLMLGPLEDALRGAEPAVRGEALHAMHRNALRLVKLVNALLDFSRLEAGRMEAVYEPTDLATTTADLASSFRSAIERGGLRLTVDTPPLSEPAYVDRQMWEKVVLNLLSNAFKFTFDGEINVALRETAQCVVLEVRDTGIGIDPSQLPRIFDRFHRVEGARSRSEEGSGIGLALVRELVRLHGGDVEVASQPGEGTTFRVLIPRGSEHLPSQRIGVPRALASTATGAAPYVEEAARWLPDEASPEATPAGSERILVVDDNADMRDYLRRVLGSRWEVDVSADGQAALEAARERPPDLVLTDVMMPRLDGFGLLRALREDDRTRHVPVVMLSARAGEEARVEGLGAGADEYLVKPFSARELVARVGSQIALAKARAAAAAHRAEADLHKRNFASLLMQAPTPICIIRGPDLIVDLANPSCCDLWGRTPADVTGRPLLDALPELRGQGFDDLLTQVMRTGQSCVGKEKAATLQRAGGAGTVFLNFLYEPLRDVDGNVDGVMVIAFDVTDEVIARDQLEKLRSDAEAASRAKDEFLAMLSHELRNPLAPMITALHLLRMRGGGMFDRELSILDRQARHLVRLIDDLLDVSRLARGKVELMRTPIEIATVVAHAVEMVEPLLEEKRHRLAQSVPRNGLRVHGDAERLAQVVSNLLTNAARYTPPGGLLEVIAETKAGDVEIVVRDSGDGIAPELLPHIFDLFVQGRRDAGQGAGGLGLGLAIVRSLVQLHGGSVSASSGGSGRGSEFRVRLPKAPESPATTPALPLAAAGSAASAGRRVLVVDDNRDAADLLGEALTMDGHTVRVAYDGPSAMTAAAELHPEVALLDIGLPVQDGYEVARQLIESDAYAGLRLIAITGYGTATDRERSREAGFYAHLTKPLDLANVRSLVASGRPEAVHEN